MKKIILKGIPASPGKVSGKIRIIKSAKEISKLSNKDIAVLDFLTPDFIAKLKVKSNLCGIITNEGGVTCHAAIVARELKIPYIAGTTNATKKLKADTLIKMDAYAGVIYGEV